jgi:hypothetical protein
MSDIIIFKVFYSINISKRCCNLAILAYNFVVILNILVTNIFIIEFQFFQKVNKLKTLDCQKNMFVVILLTVKEWKNVFEGLTN